MPDPFPLEEENKPGCLARGCLIVLIFILVLAGFIGWGAYRTWYQIKSLTTSSPQPLALRDFSPKEKDSALNRWHAFLKATRQKKPASLQLTASDLNVLVTSEPELANVRGHIAFEIEKDLLKTRLSLPLEKVPRLHGRYFNGTISWGISLENGTLLLQPRLIKADGQFVPPDLLKAFDILPWAEYVRANPTVQEILDQSQNVRVRKGTLEIINKY